MFRKSLNKQQVEYLGHSLTKRADCFTVGRKALTVHIHMENVEKDWFRLGNTEI